MQTEYKVGTHLVYDTYGICKLTETENISFSKGTPKALLYFIAFEFTLFHLLCSRRKRSYAEETATASD